MEVKVVMSCNCQQGWHDWDVPPTLGAPVWCTQHGDVNIVNVNVHGVATFFVRDANGDWREGGERIVTDNEIASMLATLSMGEGYDTFPAFTQSIPPSLVVIY